MRKEMPALAESLAAVPWFAGLENPGCDEIPLRYLRLMNAAVVFGHPVQPYGTYDAQRASRNLGRGLCR
jgi:hypothetical protein